MKKVISLIALALLVGCDNTASVSGSEAPSSSSAIAVAKSSAAAAAEVTISSSSTQAAQPVVKAPVVSTPTPVYASVTYTAGSNTTYGQFFISFTVINKSKVPIKVSGLSYSIYGSAGGALSDIVLTRNEYSTAWIPVGGSVQGWLEGYSAKYIPYSFLFTVSAIGSDGGSNWDNYTGIFSVYLTKKAAPEAIPMTHGSNEE